MWFTLYGNNFHIAGTKTDMDSLRRDLRKLTQARFQNVRKMADTANSFSGQKKRIIATLTNLSVHIFYKRLQLESGIKHISIVGMVYLVHWTILYRSSGFTFSFDPSAFLEKKGSTGSF